MVQPLVHDMNINLKIPASAVLRYVHINASAHAPLKEPELMT